MIIKLLNGLSTNLAWFSLEIQIKILWYPEKTNFREDCESKKIVNLNKWWQFKIYLLNFTKLNLSKQFTITVKF
jgi:hypothetical protein